MGCYIHCQHVAIDPIINKCISTSRLEENSVKATVQNDLNDITAEKQLRGEPVTD